MIEKEKEKVQDLIRQLVVFREDFNDLQKIFSRIQNETNKLYIKLDAMLDAN